MKNLTFLSVCILVMITSGHTQNVEVIWGPTLKSPKRTELSKLVSLDNNEIYTFSIHYSVNWEEEYPWLNKYNSNLELEFSNQIKITTYSNAIFNLPSRPITANIIDFYLMDNQFILLSSIFALNNRTDYFLGQHITKEGIPTPEHVILEQPYGSSMTFPYRVKKDFILSPDSSKLFIYANSPYKKGNKATKVGDKYEHFQFKVLNNDFSMLWQSERSLPYMEGKISNNQFIVANDGTVFLLLNHWGEDHKDFIILSYNGNAFETKEIEFNQPKDLRIENIKLTIDPDDNIICAGFYSARNEPNVFGSFKLVIDGTSHEIKSYKVTDFEKEMLLGFLTKKDLKDQDWQDDYKIKELLFLDNGNMVMIAQDESNLFEPHYLSRSEHLLVVNFNTDGTTKWVTHIPKKQYLKYNEEFLSYSAASFNNHVYILYNDLENNTPIYKAKELNEMSKLNKGLILLITIAPDGNYTKRPLLKTNEVGTLILPELSFNTSKNETLIYVEKGKTHKIGRVTYK